VPYEYVNRYLTVLYQVSYTHVVPTRIRPIITITIDAEQEKALRSIKDTEGVPVSFQVRKALEMWFEKKGIKSGRQRVSKTRPRP